MMAQSRRRAGGCAQTNRAAGRPDPCGFQGEGDPAGWGKEAEVDVWPAEGRIRTAAEDEDARVYGSVSSAKPLNVA